jgi:type III secretion protein C
LNTARVMSTTDADVFAEIAKGVQTLLSEHASFNLDRKAGLLQVTDFQERLDRVATYLEAVEARVYRQVEIDARILEVELNDPNVAFVDLAALAPGAPAPSGSRRMLSGLGPGDVTRFLAALATQGKVSVLADPHILTLNNEPAVVRAVITSGSAGSRASKDSQAPLGALDEEGVTLAVTPQIAGEGAIMLSLSPIVSLRADEGGKSAPATAIRETDTLARIADGATLVLAGFTREREVRERQASGIKGGWFGRSTVVTKKHVELIVLLTPRLVSSGEAP